MLKNFPMVQLLGVSCLNKKLCTENPLHNIKTQFVANFSTYLKNYICDEKYPIIFTFQVQCRRIFPLNNIIPHLPLSCKSSTYTKQKNAFCDYCTKIFHYATHDCINFRKPNRRFAKSAVLVILLCLRRRRCRRRRARRTVLW